MDAQDIIRDFTAKGVQLVPTDHGTIIIKPLSRITDADRDLLRQHKAILLAELQNGELVDLVNIDSGLSAPARIVHDQKPKFTDDDYAKAEREAIQWESGLPPDDDATGTAGVPGFENLPDLTPAEHGVIQRRLMGLPDPAPDRVTGVDYQTPTDISALPLAEQAAALMAQYPPDAIEQLVHDLRVVACNHPLADLIERTTDATPPEKMQHRAAMAPRSPFGDGVVTRHPDGSMLIQYLQPIETTRPAARKPAPASVTCGSCAEFEPGPTHWGGGIGRCARTANGRPPVSSRGYGACYPMAPRTCSDFSPITEDKE